MSFTVLGTGHAVPEYVLTNDMLSQMVDTSDEWITTRTGIRERHICTTESMEDLAATAAENALSMAGIAATELDMILCATMQGDYLTPSLACMVQARIGATCPAMDVNAACTGFIYALDAAAGYFARGRVRRMLVIGVECMSKHTDWAERSTCVLFGDGAGAVVLGPGNGLLATRLTADGNPGFLNIPGKPNLSPMAKPPEDMRQTIYMNGQEVYRFAVLSMCATIQDAMADAGITMADVRYVLAHQANLRILEAAKTRLKIDDDKLIVTIDRYGNTSCATIPIMLDEVNREGKIRPGDILALCAFGGGLTAGAAILQWG